MKNWLQKLLVSTVAVLTLGLITPSHAIWENLLEHNNNHRTQLSKQSTATENYIDTVQVHEAEDAEAVSEAVLAQAKEQAYVKFGSKIGPKISNEFDNIIFPKIEEVIHMTLDNVNQEEMKNLAITEKPSGNYSEKMFHIYNASTGKDVIRFHVRTENRPFDGYYYNFHYHTYTDQFASHYDLGEIYWSKNTPPKWLS
ncbi:MULTISPECIES: YpjP family protein [Rummeliibacillus]|uniref:YpjP family protein n=1 Tax=Rummeliibacillus TaxID=648802 RepID=UPI0011B74D02|nr:MULTISPECIES: YpjP family protein [Rummeliibacillus]MBO2537051.1 YpjP family protein [Rummeliibacillus suwonensis]